MLLNYTSLQTNFPPLQSSPLLYMKLHQHCHSLRLSGSTSSQSHLRGFTSFFLGFSILSENFFLFFQLPSPWKLITNINSHATHFLSQVPNMPFKLLVRHVFTVIFLYCKGKMSQTYFSIFF